MPEWANPHIVGVYALIKFSLLVLVVGSLDLETKAVTLLITQLFSAEPELENGLFTPSWVTLVSDVASFV